MVERIITYISIFLALLLVLPVHEFAHAFCAVRCGDNTPKNCGRYTLNPLSHFDIAGLVCFVLVGFGWAKPVPINPNNFKNRKRDGLLVSVAGVLANFLLAFIAYPLFVLSLRIPEFGYFTRVLQLALYYVFSLSITFFIFNLIPIYPLDGFRIYEAFSKKGKAYYTLKRYGIYLLYALVLLGIVADFTGMYYLDVLGRALSFVRQYVQIPITAFWGLIF